MAFKQDNSKKSTAFNKISIGLASPEEILRLSSGEVLKPETINYRSYKPERDGLFCEHIFGPTKDYECSCGKYKRIRYKGIVCDRCGVEVTEKKVRRERMGHIQLVVPVAHIWYFRSLPNKMGYLLGMPTKKLESIIYYEKYVVVQSGVLQGQEIGEEIVEDHMLLDEDQYNELLSRLPQDNEYLEDTRRSSSQRWVPMPSMTCSAVSTSTTSLTSCATKHRKIARNSVRPKHSNACRWLSRSVPRRTVTVRNG